MTKDQTSGAGEHREAIACALLPWYGRERRLLPWREEVTAYRVWVSEVMLQQTRVDVVVPYYERFMGAFPSLKSLADADVDSVLALWSGLGYYRRARSLHAGAFHVLEHHGGVFPSDFESALRVPGVGRYTAGAILSIAYQLPVPVVDGNVERVLTRVFALPGDPKRAQLARRLRSLALECVPETAPGDFNQSLMELGATICTPQNPKCDRCPLNSICLARKNDEVRRFPELPPKRKSVNVTLQAAIVRQRNHYMLEQVEKSSFLRGMWMFPFTEAKNPACLLETLRGQFDAEFAAVSSLNAIKHTITFRKITVEAAIYQPATLISTRGKKRFRWARLDELGSTIPVSSLALKIRQQL